MHPTSHPTSHSTSDRADGGAAGACPADERRLRTRRPALRLAAACALLAGGAVAAPASGSVVSVADGWSVTVVHNIDMVVVNGGRAGENVTVEVVRDGVVTARASGPLVNSRDGVVLEVNHGPAGEPAPGDCWESSTTNDIVQVGDHIVVTYGTLLPEPTAEVVVDDLRFTGGASKDLLTGDIVVPFFLAMADGSTPTNLDGEFRSPRDNQFRATPTVREAELPAGAPGADHSYELVYPAPDYGVDRNDPGFDPETELLKDGHTAMFGHLDGAPESQMVEGFGNSPGPAPGCPAPGGGGGEPPDTTAPSTPEGLQATAAGSTRIDLAWGPSTDDTRVAGYEISRDGTVIDTVTATGFRDGGLQPSTSYRYDVRAVDAAGNRSTPATATARTDAGTPPPPDRRVSIGNRSALEGDPLPRLKAFRFRVQLSAVSSTPVTVQYATAAGPTNRADAGTDYRSKNATLTIPAGARSRNVTIQVVRDRAREAHETFTVVLTRASGASIADGSGLGTIQNDD